MFHLFKWYADCVTGAGDAAILYWARLRWGIVTIRYGAALLKPRDDELATATTLRPGPTPQIRDDTIDWRCERLGVSGRWQARGDSISRRLLDQGDGMVEWECLCPRGDVSLRVGGRSLDGLGYVERLTVTVAPWRLPLTGLRWGRFISPSEAVAWIEWSGPLARTWVFTEHGEHPDASITRHGVRMAGSQTALEFDTDAVFRSAPVAHALPPPLRPAALFIPGWRRAHETKWLARGILSRPEGSSTGWVIHEVVRWA